MGMQLHVIFGTGPLGQAVMRELLTKDNVQIRMVNRSGKRGDIPAQVEVVASDAYDAAKVKEVTKGAAVVYQCAQPEYTEWGTKFRPLQTAILEGTAPNGAKLIVGENCYMYGDTDGKPLTENLPYLAHGTKGVVRAEIAQELLDAHQAGKIRVAMARGSDFYGEGVEGAVMGDRVFGFMLEGKGASVFGDIDVPHTQTYIGDFGKGMVILGEREEALGRAWHIPSAEPNITSRQFIERIATEMQIEAKISVMPKIMFEVISMLHPMLREFRELRYEFEKPFIVDHSDFVKTFGNIATPTNEAIKRTVVWYQQMREKVTG